MENNNIGAQYGCSKPVGLITIDFNIELIRKLTSEERYFISEKLDDISKFISRNIRLNDPESKAARLFEKKQLLECFGDNKIYANPIKSLYYTNSVNPWFEVTTSKGIIIIGWRASVILINWEKSDINFEAIDLFPDEEVTMRDKMIHTNDYSKAAEYITVILSKEVRNYDGI